MSDFASQLRQRARCFKDTEQITTLLNACMCHLEIIANSGQYAVPWIQIKPRVDHKTEMSLLKRLEDAGIELVQHKMPPSSDPREHDWIELKW